MTNYPWDDATENQITPPQDDRITDGATTGQGHCDCPYGQPAPAPNKGSRILLWIMVGIAAAFVIGFGSYAIYLSVQDSLASSRIDREQTTVSRPEEAPADDDGTENPVGTGTNPDFAGLVFAGGVDGSLSAKNLFRAVEPSIVTVTLRQTDGELLDYSGIVLTKDGYLLTTAHAVNYSRTADVTVITSDGKSQTAQVVGYDAASDVAVLKVDRRDLSPVTLGKADAVSVGDSIYTVTSAGGEAFHGVLTRGIVSAVDLPVAYDGVSSVTCFQTDASVSWCGDGGALVNGDGQVVGLALSGNYVTGEAGESYAIPIQQIRDVVEDLIRQGYLSGKVRLGITGVTLTESDAQTYGTPQGVAIVTIATDSVFAGTDAVVGDIITAVDGETVTGMDDLLAVLKKYQAGDQVEVTLYRLADTGEGETLTVTVTLLADEGETQK